MTIIVRCDECGNRYRIRDERAGKSVKCQDCGHIITIPAADDEQPRSADGTTMYRHEFRNREFEPALGDEENIELISEHIECHVGPVEMVFHELVSDLVHIDLHWVAATEDRPYHTLVTSGMSDRAMVTPDEAAGFQYAELAMCLPPEWPLSQEAFEDERNYWPLRLMKQLARLPHEFETWLSVGHTVPNGDPAAPYSQDTELCCALLLPTIQLGEDFHQLTADGRDIYFYNVFPLYVEEMQFKLNRGLDALFDRMDKGGLSDILDLRRRNVCRKRFWLF